jgi:hypothetical protein
MLEKYPSIRGHTRVAITGKIEMFDQKTRQGISVLALAGLSLTGLGCNESPEQAYEETTRKEFERDLKSQSGIGSVKFELGNIGDATVSLISAEGKTFLMAVISYYDAGSDVTIQSVPGNVDPDDLPQMKATKIDGRPYGIELHLIEFAGTEWVLAAGDGGVELSRVESD